MSDNLLLNQPMPFIWERIANAIKTGSLQDLKKCCIGKSEINSLFPNFMKLDPVPAINKTANYFSFTGLTILEYAILCEQVEIIKYLVEKKKPDFSVASFDGFKAVHIASLIKETSILEYLLKKPEFLKTLSDPIVDPYDKSINIESTTNALHAACSNSLYKTVLLLAYTNPQIEEDFESEDEIVYKKIIDINSLTTNHSSCLHIAVTNKDYKLAYLLTSLDININLQDSNQKTALDYINDWPESSIKEKWLELFDNSIPKNSLENIISCINENKDFTIIDPYNLPNMDEDQENLRLLVTQLTEKVKELNQKVEQLQKGSPQSQQQQVRDIHLNQCYLCGNSFSQECSKCHRFYCSKCMKKSGHIMNCSEEN